MAFMAEISSARSSFCREGWEDIVWSHWWEEKGNWGLRCGFMRMNSIDGFGLVAWQMWHTCEELVSTCDLKAIFMDSSLRYNRYLIISSPRFGKYNLL